MPDLQYTLQELADIYDLGNSGAEDRDFYLSLAGTPPQDILDLGCGTGLVCDAFASLGHNVTGVDPAPAMLSVARRKPHADSITWVENSAQAYKSDNRFDLIIMTGHAFQVLLTEQDVLAALATMHRHLKPNGNIVFESRNPNIDWDKQWPRTVKLAAPGGEIVARRRLLSSDKLAATISFAWDYDFGDEVLTSESTLWFPDHERIIRLSSETGLELVSLLGDWDGAAFAPASSREMIFKFQKKVIRK